MIPAAGYTRYAPAVPGCCILDRARTAAGFHRAAAWSEADRVVPQWRRQPIALRSLRFCGDNLGVLCDLCDLCGYPRGLQLCVIWGAGLGTCPGAPGWNLEFRTWNLEFRTDVPDVILRNSFIYNMLRVFFAFACSH